MLKTATVSPDVLKCLKTLMEMPSLKNHRLVGGTALALQIGHRISIDIDLFSDKKNNYASILKALGKKLGKQLQEGYAINSPMGKGISVFISNIKTDVLDWNTKFIRPAITEDGIRMAAKEDIIPMKFNTFLCPAEFARYEKKDYVDIARLLKEFSLEQMMDLYKAKYPRQFMFDRMMIEGLQLAELADKKLMPNMLIDLTWDEVKKQIDRSILLYAEKRMRGK